MGIYSCYQLVLKIITVELYCSQLLTLKKCSLVSVVARMLIDMPTRDLFQEFNEHFIHTGKGSEVHFNLLFKRRCTEFL